MPEPIDKIEALGKLQTMYIQIECACGDGNPVAKGVRKAYKAIERMPTIEPEVRHGRWIKSDVYTFKKCSECGAIWDAALCENIFFIYCPRCGSKNGGADNG